MDESVRVGGEWLSLEYGIYSVNWAESIPDSNGGAESIPDSNLAFMGNDKPVCPLYLLYLKSILVQDYQLIQNQSFYLPDELPSL